MIAEADQAATISVRPPAATVVKCCRTGHALAIGRSKKCRGSVTGPYLSGQEAIPDADHIGACRIGGQSVAARSQSSRPADGSTFSVPGINNLREHRCADPAEHVYLLLPVSQWKRQEFAGRGHPLSVALWRRTLHHGGEYHTRGPRRDPRSSSLVNKVITGRPATARTARPHRRRRLITGVFELHSRSLLPNYPTSKLRGYTTADDSVSMWRAAGAKSARATDETVASRCTFCPTFGSECDACRRPPL